MYFGFFHSFSLFPESLLGDEAPLFTRPTPQNVRIVDLLVVFSCDPLILRWDGNKTVYAAAFSRVGLPPSGWSPSLGLVSLPLTGLPPSDWSPSLWLVSLPLAGLPPGSSLISSSTALVKKNEASLDRDQSVESSSFSMLGNPGFLPLRSNRET